MLLRIKRTLPFFILFSILFFSVLAPLFAPADEFSPSSMRRPGVSVNFVYPDGNICCPETKNELFIRGEARIFPGLGTSLISTPVRCTFTSLALGKYIIGRLFHFESNPVKIAQYYHLGDGMK